MKRIIKIIFIIPIKIYQIFISPLFPPKCIYTPSCSTYSINSINTHGPFKGILLGVLRILRCSPFFKGGFDPVIEGTTIKKELGKYKQFLRRREKCEH